MPIAGERRTAAPKDVLLGVIDVAGERVETPEEVAATIEQASRFVPIERLYPCTNCGMRRGIARCSSFYYLRRPESAEELELLKWETDCNARP